MTDLREKVEDVLREAHRRGRKSGRSRDTTPYTLCDLNDAIMALVQPVVTDEMVERGFMALPTVPDRHGFRAVLAAALPHAVTRHGVLEELAVEAEKPALSWIDAEGLNIYTTPAWLARYFRARKGGA